MTGAFNQDGVGGLLGKNHIRPMERERGRERGGKREREEVMMGVKRGKYCN